MDDMNAFDRQLAGVVLQRVGPSRPVHDAAIFTAITAAQSPKWRFQSMFSAAKFVVAGAIVALFGGFLLAGVLTQPSEDPVPAAGAATPASISPVDPTRALDRYMDMRARLTTKEIAPGVQAVINDGAGHELTDLGDDGLGGSITVAPDGSVWLLGQERFVELGRPGTYPGAPSRAAGYDLAFAPDGTPWALSANRVHRFSDSDWLRVSRGLRPLEELKIADLALEVLSDGSVWTRDQQSLARLDGDSWTTFPFADAAIPLPDEDQWVFPVDLASTPDGSLWVAFSTWERNSPPRGGLARFDGSSWRLVEPLGEGHRHVPMSLASGRDGSLWAALSGCEGEGCEEDTSRWHPFLARLDEDGWTVLGEADGVAPVGKPGWWVGQMAITADGRLLADVDDGDFGSVWRPSHLAIFDLDGREATLPNLDGRDGVASMAGAPDGTFWVLDGSLFIIDPEAVTATEQ